MRLIYPPVGKAQQKRKQAGLLDTAPQRPVQRRQAEVRVDELAIYLDLGPGQFVQFVARDSWRVPMYLWEQNDPSAWVSVW
jgi:hypothetical protein